MSTKIEWTDATWNPTRGCSPVSPGCKNCYAERMAGRFCAEGEPFHGFVQIGKNGRDGAHWAGRVELIESKLTEPLHWRKPRRVFVNSMSDLFHGALPAEAIDRVFAVMALTPHITYQVLTKRPERMLAYLGAKIGAGNRGDVITAQMQRWLMFGRDFPAGRSFQRYCEAWPLPNVWLGVSVEDQNTADERIPMLLQTPAAIRFVSYEPALGPVDFNWIKRLLPWASDSYEISSALEGNDGFGLSMKRAKLDWVIVGGESGPGARPFDIAWARSVIAQCKAAGVAVFCKQLGADPFEIVPHPDYDWEPRGLRLHDRKGGDPAEWPEDLRVRQFPEVRNR